LVSIGATGASSLVRHTGVIFGEPIRTSNCPLAQNGASCCYGVRRQETTAMESELGGLVDAVATASLIENWIDGQSIAVTTLPITNLSIATE
jgi:hypothetical protein